MTITVHENIIDGIEFGDNVNGAFATRVFRVTVTDPETETMAQILQNAGIPQYADIHPDTGDTGGFAAIYAFERRCVPLENDNTIYQVTVNYSRPDAQQQEPSEEAADAIIQIGSSVTATKTQKDKDDTQLVVTLNGVNQNAEVDIQAPQAVLQFQRKESSHPMTKSRTYVGKVNSVALATGTYPIGTLLCLGIDGESIDGGDTYLVTYRFQYEPITWKATLVFRDPETDLPAEGVNLSTSAGVLVADIYDEADFGNLNLPFPS